MADKTIRENFFDAKSVGALWDVAVSLKRGNPLPIDADSVFESEAKLIEYIGDKVTTVAYPGQVVAVVNADSTQIYYIDQDLNYHEVGSKLTADGKSIKVSNNVLSLAGFDTAADGLLAQVKVDAQGNRTLNWVSIETIAQGDGNTTYTFTGLGKESSVSFSVKASDVESATNIYLDAYSRDEVDTKLKAITDVIGVKAEGETEATGLYKAIEEATYDDTDLLSRVSDIESDYVDSKELQDAIDAIQVPVTGVVSGDKVLSLTDKNISATITLTYDEDTSSIKLVGKDGADLGSVDATDFLVDGMLDDVSYDSANNTLTFTWNTAAGSKTDTVQLSDILDPYSAANGITIDGTSIGLKLDTATEGFLTVGVDGLKLSGVQSAIDSAKAEAIADAKGKVDAVASDLSTLSQTVIDNKALADATEQKATQNASAIEQLQQLPHLSADDVNGLIEQGTSSINSDIEALQEADDEHSALIEGLQTLVGDDTTGLVKDVADLKAVDVDGKINGALQSYDTSDEVDAKVKTVQDAVDAIEIPVKSVEQSEFTLTDGKLSVNAIAQNKVTGLAEALEALASKDTIHDTNIASNTTSINNLTTRINDITAQGGEPNTINEIKANGVALAIVDKIVDIPAATFERFGLVKLGSEFQTSEDGALEIKSVNVNKLVQTDGESLILDGGSADDLLA